MNIGTEAEPVEVPLPVHPDEQPAEMPEPQPDAAPGHAEPVPA